MKYIYPALLAISLLLLQGCSPSGLLTPPIAPGSNAAQAEASIQQANQLLKQGKKREAAQVYYRAANSYPSPQRERIILQAAEIAASIGDAALTNTYLGRAPKSSLDGENRGRYDYVKALLALQSDNPNLALQTLPTDLKALSPALREKVRHIRQRALAMGGSGSRQAGTARVNVQAALIPESSERIAVLLPGSGSLGSVSNEIYQGMEAAQSTISNNSRLKRYSTTTGNVVSQYQAAVTDGADIIVGPLDKESLAQLLEQPQTLTRPLLSLNYLTSSRLVPGALYQFGLLPEDEARQVADFAVARGQRSAIMLTPDSAWGDRLADAFRSAYQQRGGNIVHAAKYPDSPSNYLQHVQNALAASQGRADMVFLAASPSQARLMRPLLLAQAPNLPVYATSHIFSGRPDPSKDVDLDGIIYTEIPWIFESQQNGSINNATYPRMYALGMDAFLIAKNLPSIARNPNARVNGKTGNISIASNRQVQRRLSLATFANGIPRLLGQ